MITSVELTSTILRLDSVIKNAGEPLIEYQSTYRGPNDPGGDIDGVPVHLVNQIYLSTLNYQKFLYRARKKLKEVEEAIAANENSAS